MPKRKNQDAAKRREAKKRKNSLKRKAQVRTTSVRNTQVGSPTGLLTAPKLSVVILDYAEPLIEATIDTLGEEKAIHLSITFWNSTFLPQRQALENLNPAFKDMANGDMQLEYDLKAMYEMMYDRKQNLFSNDQRFIMDYSLEKNNEGFYLQVASRPLKP